MKKMMLINNICFIILTEINYKLDDLNNVDKILDIMKRLFLLAETGEITINDIKYLYSIPMTLLKTKHLINYSNFYYNNIRLTWYNSLNLNTDNIIIYFHGGGYCIGSSEIYFPLCKKIRNQIKEKDTNFLLIDYKKAPEYSNLEIINSTYLCYKHIISLFDDKNIIFMGDSAGANLAIQICNLAIVNKIKKPNALICMSPWIISNIKKKYWEQNQDRDYLTPYTINLAKEAFFKNNDRNEFNILNYNYDLFPEILIRAGGNELILDEILVFINILKKSKCIYTFDLISNMPHSFDLFYSYFKDDSPKFNKLIEFINKYTSK